MKNKQRQNDEAGFEDVDDDDDDVDTGIGHYIMDYSNNDHTHSTDDYVERGMRQRQRRDVVPDSRMTSTTVAPLVTDNETSTSADNNASQHRTEPYETAFVYDKNEIILTNLKHFTEYSIEVC